MLIVILLIFIILNGKFTFEILGFGIFVSALCYLFLGFFTTYSFKKELKFVKKMPYIISYLFILLLNVISSNLNVIKLILKPKATPSPYIVHLKLDFKSEIIKAVVANSITLTPGTITVSVDDDIYTVHCLKKEYFEGFEKSLLVRLARKIEE